MIWATLQALTDLVKALVLAGWRPISVVNVVGTCGVVFAVLKLPIDPNPRVENFAPVLVLVVFILVCMTFIVVTADDR